MAPGVILAQAIGRLGNYFNQELYGRPTNRAVGAGDFRAARCRGALDTLNGVSTGQLVAVVHPTFLYELIWNVLVFVFLIWADRRFRLGHGRLFALYVAAYCVGRFGVELMRSDYATLIAGIRMNSFTSTFVFLGAVVYMMVAPKGREDPATLVGRVDHGDDGDDEASPFDEVGKELTVVASTSGVVAAATVAGAEDESSAGTDIADEAEAVEVQPDETEELDSDEVEAESELGPEVEPETEPEADSEPEAEPEVEATEPAEVEATDGVESPAPEPKPRPLPAWEPMAPRRRWWQRQR